MNLVFPILKQAPSPEMGEAALAAIEYTLASSITIRDASDIKSLKHWSERLKPFEHQVENLITFCRRAPVALIADDVGMGKTISAGLIVSELMVRKKVKRVLILAPKILLPQWCDELRDKFGIPANSGTGEDLSRLAKSKAEVVVTTYASALSRMDELNDSDFDMLILDEAHKVRNLYGTSQPPKIAEALRSAMTTGAYRYSLLLTATPIHNRLWDVYSLIDILSAGRNHENPLGSPDYFAYRYLDDGKAVARRLVPGRIPEFRRIVGEYMVRTSRADSGLAFPGREVKPRRCQPGAVERELEELVREYLPRLNRLQQISLAEALMSSPSALAKQLANAAENGRVPAGAVTAANRIAQSSPLGCKAKHLVGIAKRLRENRPNDWRLVVFTRRIATQKAIGDALTSMGANVGYIGGSHSATQDQAVKGFQASPPSVNVIVSTDAGAEGVNLQAGNVVVNYDLPWNPMIVEQRIGRVQRLASKHATVVVTNLVVQGSVEELVVARLMEKLQLISEAIGDIEGILEVVNLDDGLEDDIKDLVLKALAGQDVEASTRKILESIDRAKRLYDESRELVSESLGGLRGMHTFGPAAPELADVVPRLSVRELVSRCFMERGSVEERPEGRLLIEEPGGVTHLATFDANDPILKQRAGVFGGKGIEFYAEGEPAFERIVGDFARRRFHDVARPAVDDYQIGLAVEDWMAERLPVLCLKSYRRVGQSSRFHGTVSALVSCSVAVDRLERIVEARSGGAGWYDVEEARLAGAHSGPRADGQLDQGAWPEAAKSALSRTISEDGSVRAFQEFYLARLAEELKKADRHPTLIDQVRSRFEPSIGAEVVSASGELRPVTEVEVAYEYPEGRPSSLKLLVDGATGDLMELPAVATCTITGATVPESDLGSCSVSNDRALLHLLKVSSVSGSLMLPVHAKVCEVSGDVLLPGETVRSDFSSRTISPKYSTTCAVTKRTAAIDEVEVCAFTGSQVHAQSIATSEISGKGFRLDEAARSALSGTLGHASEFSKCEVSNASVLASELRRSDSSGKMVRKDWLIASVKNPDRFAANNEVVRCQVTNKVLLPDETGESAVSGLRVDKDLLVRSALSGSQALASEMFTCEVSGSLVMPLETETCAATGKRVRRDLVDISGISSLTFLKSLLLRCPESGLLGAEDEMGVCEATELHVAPKELERCSVTGKLVVRRLLVQCGQCEEWLLRSEAVRTDAGELAHGHHVATSAFSGGTYLASELGTCAASQLRLEPDELNGRYAKSLVAVAAACARDAPHDSSIVSLASQLLETRRIKVKNAWSRPSPRQSLDAVLVEGPWRLIGLRRRYAFFVDRARQEMIGELVRVEIDGRSITFSPVD